jgi:hypothetical protein
MGANEDGDHGTGRDWLDGRRGLDREALERVEAEPSMESVPVAREEEAGGILSGAWLGGSRGRGDGEKRQSA